MILGTRPSNGTCDSDAFAQGEQCTLRAAIQEANNTSDADTINFNIGGGAGVKTINVGSSTGASGQPLPPITQPVTIDGYTQGDATPDTADDAKENDIPVARDGTNAKLLMELDGSTTGSSGDGLTINASNVVVRGLVINRFRNGIVISVISSASAMNNRVEGNFIGTDASGTTDLGNTGDGVSLFSGPGANIIGGTSAAAHNLISGNRWGLTIT